MNWILGALIAVLVAAGGLYYVSSGDMEQESMMGEEAMQKPDAMMENDAMPQDAMEADAMKKDETMMSDDVDSMMMQKGSYEEYSAEKLARANEGDVILFFRAGWCPTCRALDEDIRKNLSKIPAGVTILDVDYDSETALKQKYGVTYQHTLVQVDASGNLITKWSGGLTLADFLTKVQ